MSIDKAITRYSMQQRASIAADLSLLDGATVVIGRTGEPIELEFDRATWKLLEQLVDELRSPQ